MSLKSSKFRTTLGLFLAAFGVCSVSLEIPSAFARSSSRDLPRTASSKSPEPTVTLTPFAPGTHNLSLGVGQIFLLGSLGNTYENSIGPQLDYTYGVSDLFAFESNFGYHSHSSGNLSIWNLAAGLRANLLYFDQLVPFATIGFGFFKSSQTTPGATPGTIVQASALLFGMQLGTGIDLLISNNVFFGTRLTYNNMFNSNTNTSSGTRVSIGGSYASFMVHAGLTF